MDALLLFDVSNNYNEAKEVLLNHGYADKYITASGIVYLPNHCLLKINAVSKDAILIETQKIIAEFNKKKVIYQIDIRHLVVIEFIGTPASIAGFPHSS